MRKLVLGMSALALVASAAAFAGDEDSPRVATAQSMTPSFTKLDADADGRISAIEAANNSRFEEGYSRSALIGLPLASASSGSGLCSEKLCAKSQPTAVSHCIDDCDSTRLATQWTPSTLHA